MKDYLNDLKKFELKKEVAIKSNIGETTMGAMTIGVMN